MKAISYKRFRNLAVCGAFIWMLTVFLIRNNFILSFFCIFYFIMYLTMALDLDISYEEMKTMEKYAN